MYEAHDPRSKLAAQGTGATAAPAGFAAAAYVKFHELPPVEQTAQARTWYGRGQNMVVGYSECEPGAQFARHGQVDEYMLVLPEPGEGAVIEAGAQHAGGARFSLPSCRRATAASRCVRRPVVRCVSTPMRMSRRCVRTRRICPPASEYPAVQGVARAPDG